jgi:GTP diphosphokinase / guanosine-3',5'-bis(diphosphate) 3'-diphosphatase
VIRQYELLDAVRSYDRNLDEALLNRAYVFSMRAHGSQTRESGDPYFSHPLEVAGILTGLKLDCATIATALLHDTIEDTVATYEELEKHFGPEVAKLVDGVTKLSRLELTSEHQHQAENFRKFLLATSNDIRVLLVKLADRLHNMRTLTFLKDNERRRRIATETLEIYAPLAERIGMQEMKDELEDLAFLHINPEARNSLVARLEFLRKNAGDVRMRVIQELRDTFAKAGLKAKVLGREKRPYSIWKKMELGNVPFEHLSDVMAFRVITESRDQCYHALGVIHQAWPMVPGRFKEYISTPKRNGYRSIHTTVIGPEQQRIEIQIRTRRMHEEAEFGVAAHWKYKQGSEKIDGTSYRWIRELLEILEHASSPEEFLENTKLEMFQDQVFCFTPKGELITMPLGATPVDFAYAVHTDVGDSCVGAKVNSRMVPLRTVLTNGDQVEIVRSNVMSPSPVWENFVVTGKARAAIRRFVRKEERKQYSELGRTIVEQAFKKVGHDFAEKALEGAMSVLQYKTVEDLYVAVGSGIITSRFVLEKVFPGEKPKEERWYWPPLKLTRRKKKGNGHASPIPIKGLTPGLAVHIAECCHPVPGDRIVGVTTAGKGIAVHTIDCDILDSFSDQPERWLDIAWDSGVVPTESMIGRVLTVGIDQPGTLNAITAIIARNHGNIRNLKITDRDAEFFGMTIDIDVRDVKHLTDIITALRAAPTVTSVERARG